jgi:hypothetical protein
MPISPLCDFFEGFVFSHRLTGYDLWKKFARTKALNIRIRFTWLGPDKTKKKNFLLCVQRFKKSRVL